MYQYILFDLDGTLTDSKPGITRCVQYALHKMGIEEPDLDKLEPFIDSMRHRGSRRLAITGSGLTPVVFLKTRSIRAWRSFLRI